MILMKSVEHNYTRIIKISVKISVFNAMGISTVGKACGTMAGNCSSFLAPQVSSILD